MVSSPPLTTSSAAASTSSNQGNLPKAKHFVDWLKQRQQVVFIAVYVALGMIAMFGLMTSRARMTSLQHYLPPEKFTHSMFLEPPMAAMAPASVATVSDGSRLSQETPKGLKPIVSPSIIMEIVLVEVGSLIIHQLLGVAPIHWFHRIFFHITRRLKVLQKFQKVITVLKLPKIPTVVMKHAKLVSKPLTNVLKPLRKALKIQSKYSKHHEHHRNEQASMAHDHGKEQDHKQGDGLSSAWVPS